MSNHESRVISALLKNNDMPAVMGENIPALLTSHKDIYDFISYYYENNRSLPPVSVVKEEFPDFDFLESLEGATKHYVESLREHRVSVVTQEMLEGAMKNMARGDRKASDVVNRLSAKLNEIQRTTGIARGVDLRDTDSAEKHYDEVREFAKLHGGQPGIASGFKYIDDVYPTGFAPGHLAYLMGYSGSMKANSLDSTVYDKLGPKRFGDLKVGDQIMGKNGQETTVTGIYPQESREAFRITLTDGTSSIVSSQHLFDIQTHKMRQMNSDKYKTVTVQEIAEKYLPREYGEVNENGKRSKTYHAYLPIADAVEFDEKELGIDPYLLGVLLANGHYSNHQLFFSTNQEEIANKVIERNPELEIVERTVSGTRRWAILKPKKIAEAIGWTDKTRSTNKYIPAEYLYGSIEQRKALLAGILDSDCGTKSGRNPEKTRPQYWTNSKELLEDVAHLIRGLGGIATPSSTQVNSNGNKCYSIRVWTPFNPFSLESRARGYNPSWRPMRAVESIEQVEDQDMQCITVSAEDMLYLVDEYIVTHNTWFAIKLAINAWEQGHNVLMVNLEMTPEELRDRIFFLISQYSMDDLVKANIDPSQFRAWSEDYMKGKARFDLVGGEGTGGFTTAMVQQKIDQYKPDIVFLDYMQLFTDRAMSQNDTSRVKNVSIELKQIAMITKVPIVIITAVTGKDKKDRLNPPEIAQVAWSSQIEYDANLAFAVHTHRNPITQKTESTEIVCRKNRHGSLFSFRVEIDMETGTVTELDPTLQEKFLDDEDQELASIFDRDESATDKILSMQGESIS